MSLRGTSIIWAKTSLEIGQSPSKTMLACFGRIRVTCLLFLRRLAQASVSVPRLLVATAPWPDHLQNLPLPPWWGPWGPCLAIYIYFSCTRSPDENQVIAGTCGAEVGLSVSVQGPALWLPVEPGSAVTSAPDQRSVSWRVEAPSPVPTEEERPAPSHPVALRSGCLLAGPCPGRAGLSRGSGPLPWPCALQSQLLGSGTK